MSGVIIVPMVDGYEVSMAADRAIFAGGDPRYPDKVHLIGIDSDWIKVDADWDEVKRIHGEAIMSDYVDSLRRQFKTFIIPRKEKENCAILLRNEGGNQ